MNLDLFMEASAKTGFNSKNVNYIDSFLSLIVFYE